MNLMRYSGEDYTAMQFDIKVPDGVFINDIVPSQALESHNFMYEMLDMNTYRIVVYADDETVFGNSCSMLLTPYSFNTAFTPLAFFVAEVKVLAPLPASLMSL